MPDTIIDDLSKPLPYAHNGAQWELLSDAVMGGVSQGRISREELAGRMANRMTGDVSLENNGGFIQMALALDPAGGEVDWRDFGGLECEVYGNGETYAIHLRTADLVRPWQSFRQIFLAEARWQVIRLPFAGFAPHRTDATLDLGRIRRLGFIAIGRAFRADLALSSVKLY